MNRISLLALAALAAFASLALTACRSPHQEEKGFVRLFDGRTLKGWAGRSDLWNVRDGTITGETHANNPLKGNTFLVWTNGAVDNFELRLEYKILNGNSGIQYRSQLMDPDAFVVGGYQADIESGKTYSGILYEERGRGILAQRGQRTVVRETDGKTRVDVIGSVGEPAAIQALIHEGDWNSYVVIAKGNHLMHFINAKMTVDVVDDQAAKAAKSGILALQVHAGPPMLVQFRNIRLMRLP